MKKLINEQNTFKVLFLFAIPLIISNLLTQSYNLVDLIIAGKALGSNALSATGCTSTFIQFLSSLFWGFGVALSTTVGELYGEGNKKEIVKVIKTILLFVSIIMLFITSMCAIFSNQILTYLKVDQEIFTLAKSYFTLFMIALFIQSVTYQITSILHGLGSSQYPLVMTLISGISNVVLNLIFVLVFKLGIQGLALATIISSSISFILGIFKMRQVILKLGGKLNFEFSYPSLKQTSLLAIPCIIQQCALYLSSVIIQPYINNMGKDYSGGYSIAMNINLIFSSIYQSLSRSTATYTSQSRGAKLYQNYKKGILYGVLIQIILVTPIAILTMIFPRPIFSIFLNNHDSSCLDYSITYVYYCLPFVYFIAFNNLMHSFYKSVKATKSVIITTSIFTISRIVLTYVIPENGKLSSVYLGLSLSWVVESIFLFAIYLTGKWKSKEQIQIEKLSHK